MRGILIAAALVGSFGLTTAAEAKGCIKGAIVGAIAGHYAGHHAISGAMAGCAMGHIIANRPAAKVVTPVGPKPATAPGTAVVPAQ